MIQSAPKLAIIIHNLIGNYDTRGDIMPRKKFTFKGRPVIKNIPLSSLAPKDTVVIRSDIDEYAEKPKFAYLIKFFFFFSFFPLLKNF